MRWPGKFKDLGRKRVGGSAASFSPSQFQDDIAERTSWEPLVSGGASLRTHKLVGMETSRLEFRPTVGSLIFCWVFILTGIGALIGFGVYAAGNWNEFELEKLALLLVGGLFAFAGIIMLKNFICPITTVGPCCERCC